MVYPITICKRVAAVCAACLALILSLPVGASAEDTPQPTLTLEYYHEDTVLSQVDFRLYRVADVVNGEGYALSGDFAGYPVSLTDLEDNGMAAAYTLSVYVSKDALKPLATRATDDNGRAVFGTLSTGLYLVIGENCRVGEVTYQTAPFLISLPHRQSDGALTYTVVAEPKNFIVTPPVEKTVDMTVVKVWEDTQAAAQRPQQIDIVLLRDGEEVQTVSLTEETHWRHTFTGLDTQYTWLVAEESVPDGYTVLYNGSHTTYTITNTYAGTTPPVEPTTPPADDPLPQTGLLQWPVWVLSLSGVALFVWGWWLVRRQRKSV